MIGQECPVIFDIDMAIFGGAGGCGALNIRRINRTSTSKNIAVSGGRVRCPPHICRQIDARNRKGHSKAVQIKNNPSLASNPSRFPHEKSLNLRFRRGQNSWRKWVHALPLGIPWSDERLCSFSSGPVLLKIDQDPTRVSSFAGYLLPTRVL